MTLDKVRYLVLIDYTYDDDTEEFVPQEWFDTHEEAEAFIKAQLEYDDSMRYRIATLAAVHISPIITSQPQG
jgi:DNA-binding phage protein